jgi:hypothetical protein
VCRLIICTHFYFDIICFGKRCKNYKQGVEFFVKQTAVKGVEFVIVIMSHIVLGVRWFNDDVPNARAIIENNIHYVRRILFEQLYHVFVSYEKTCRRCQRILIVK